MDDVFQNFTPVLASHLTPFAIVCEGHAEAFADLRLMKKAEILEGETSMLLQDAESITSADVKFPSTAYFAGKRLCGWSVVIDVFHGVAHDNPCAQLCDRCRASPPLGPAQPCRVTWRQHGHGLPRPVQSATRVLDEHLESHCVGAV